MCDARSRLRLSRRILALSLMLAALGACQNAAVDDLQAFMAEVEADTTPKPLEPLPSLMLEPRRRYSGEIYNVFAPVVD